MTQLARQFEEDPEVRYGLTALCIGIGMGGAVIWENPNHRDYGQEPGSNHELDTTKEAVA
jgi:acetyl-CoA acyltransferase